MSAACPIFGFDLRLALVPRLDGDAKSRLWDDLTSALDALGLESSAPRGDDEWQCAVWREGSQVVDRDRDAIRAWAESRAEILRTEVGPLVDRAG